MQDALAREREHNAMVAEVGGGLFDLFIYVPHFWWVL